MATGKEVEVWLNHLHGTMNFEPVFRIVFDRITQGEGRGVLIIQGPSKVANKSFFLNVVKAFQKGVPSVAAGYFPSEFGRLLAEIGTTHYQCIDIKEDCPKLVAYPNVFRVPLLMALPLSLAWSSQQRGLRKGCKTVILCNDMHEFNSHQQASNVAFLKQLDGLLLNLGEITFLAAYRLDYGNLLFPLSVNRH